MSIHSWEAICFIIFAALIFKPTRNFLIDTLNKYSNTVKKDIDDSTNIKTEAQENLKIYIKKHEELSNLLKEIQTNTEFSIKKLKEDSNKDIEDRINNKMRIHQEMIAVHQKEQILKLKLQTVSKALWISKQYIIDNTKLISSKNELQETLEVAKNKITFH